MPEPSPELIKAGPTDDARVAIAWAADFERPARMYAQQNKLPIINEMSGGRGLCLYLDQRGWSILELKQGILNFKGAFQLSLQAKYNANGRDPLIQAMGKASRILDLTAGWGTDALHIALSGRSVVAVERDINVYLLLAQAEKQLGKLASPAALHFLNLDSAADNFAGQLRGIDQQVQDFELVYLDPMFSGKHVKSAKSKKPMAIMQQLVPPPEAGNEAALFANAMKIASKRVVVKRALKAPYIDVRVPQGSIKSKLLRFDLYLPDNRL